MTAGEQLNYVDQEQPRVLHDAIVVGSGKDDVIFAYLPGKRMVCELARWNLRSEPDWDCPRFWEYNTMRPLADLDDDEKARAFFWCADDPLKVLGLAKANDLLY